MDLTAQRRIVQLAERSIQDPNAADGNLRLIHQLASALDPKQQLASLGVTHIVRAPGVTAVPANSTVVQGPFQIEWPGGEGIVRSMFAGTIDGDPATLSKVSVQVKINGEQSLMLNGQAEDFAPLIALQPQNLNWFRLADFAVNAQQKWEVRFKNESSGGPFTPFILFGYARIR